MGPGSLRHRTIRWGSFPPSDASPPPPCLPPSQPGGFMPPPPPPTRPPGPPPLSPSSAPPPASGASRQPTSPPLLAPPLHAVSLVGCGLWAAGGGRCVRVRGCGWRDVGVRENFQWSEKRVLGRISKCRQSCEREMKAGFSFQGPSSSWPLGVFTTTCLISTG